ncbi:Innexin unc-7, partial [Lamellibrachia satsuma]
EILSFFSSKKLASTGVFTDDDLVDKLNHDYTSVVLVVLAVIISARQYVGDQIQCWVPGYFTGTYVDYTGKICWVTNTYHVPFDENVADADESPNKRQISYYQWVHMMLIVQALLFYAPAVIWRSYNVAAGINLNNLIQASRKLGDPNKRDKTIVYIVRHVDRYLGHYRDPERGDVLETRCRLACGKKHGNYLMMLYMVTKFFYLGNALLQLLLMNVFLSTDFHWYGIKVLQDLARHKEWPESSRFPRVTMCDFEVRQLGNNIHRHTVQCVLPVNFFNERIYLFLWFWIVLVVLSTAFSTVNWFFRVAIERDRVRYVKLHLMTMRKLKGMSERRRCRDFVVKYLRQDGVFLLRLIGLNKDEAVVGELLAELWDLYSE